MQKSLLSLLFFLYARYCKKVLKLARNLVSGKWVRKQPITVLLQIWIRGRIPDYFITFYNLVRYSFMDLDQNHGDQAVFFSSALSGSLSQSEVAFCSQIPVNLSWTMICFQSYETPRLRHPWTPRPECVPQGTEELYRW